MAPSNTSTGTSVMPVPSKLSWLKKSASVSKEVHQLPVMPEVEAVIFSLDFDFDYSMRNYTHLRVLLYVNFSRNFIAISTASIMKHAFHEILFS